MKNLILVFLLLPLLSLAQNPDKRFSIQAVINGLPEQSVVSLSDLNNPTDTIAVTTVQKGSFTIAGTIPESNLYNLNFNGVQKKLMVFLSNDKISISGDVNNLQAIKVSGSPVHDDFMKFQNTFNPLFQELTRLNQQLSQGPGTNMNDSLMQVYLKQLSSIKSAITNFVTDNNNSPVSPFLLLVTSELETDKTILEKNFTLLKPSVQNGFYGKILKGQIEDSKIGQIGSAAIDFVQADTVGKPVSLASFRGQYVLIDFWASWCKPCRIENPNVVSAFNKFKSKNFTVLGVSLDRSRESWLQAIGEDGLTWTQVSDLKFWSNEAAQKYKIQSIPQNYLVDPNGIIVGKNLRGPELESKLCELLGCN